MRLLQFGVLSDPADVGLQRLGKLICARLEARQIVEENEIQSPQRLRDRWVLHPPAYNRREALFEQGRVRHLLERHFGGNRIGRQREHNGVGAADQRFDALPPILESIDLFAVDQRLEPADLVLLSKQTERSATCYRLTITFGLQ